MTHMALKLKLEANYCSGINFVDDGSTEWSGPTAQDEHGTAVATVAGGFRFQTPGGKMVPNGVAPNAKLYIIRVFPMDMVLQNVEKALQHLLELVTKENEKINIDIVCMSFKLPGKDESIESLLSKLASAGVLCVAAAGNGGHYQGGVDFPASDPNVLSVGALRTLGQMSDLNPRNGLIDVFAPGEDLLIPSIGTTYQMKPMDGTSFAAPMVAGFIALLIQCAKAYHGSANVIKKYHDVKFLRELFNKYQLCENRRLLHVNQFLTDIYNKELNMISLITQVYPNFTA